MGALYSSLDAYDKLFHTAQRDHTWVAETGRWWWWVVADRAVDDDKMVIFPILHDKYQVYYILYLLI